MILLLLLLSVVSAAPKRSCPPNEDTSPCICDDSYFGVDFKLVCTDKATSVDELKRILSVFDNKSILDIRLHQLNLGPIQPNFFGGLKIKTLYVVHCKLDGVLEDPGRALIGLEDTLEMLVIHSTFTADNAVSKLDLSHLRRLQYLDLSSNSITELANDWFERGPVSLRNLFLNGNGIEKLGDTAFANLVNLRALYLNQNRFGSIKRSMLPRPANRLNDLELGFNSFKSLPEDIFSGMPSLESIYLGHNVLTKIPKETFQPIWSQLKYFGFKGNNLECDSHIEWMFEMVSPKDIYGECSLPPERKDLKLVDLIKRGHL